MNKKFGWREGNVIRNVPEATNEVKKRFSMELELLKKAEANSISNQSTGFNPSMNNNSTSSFGNMPDFSGIKTDNSSNYSNSSENAKTLVRQLNAINSGSYNYQGTTNSENSNASNLNTNYQYYNGTGNSNYNSSQGNATTGSLLFMAFGILVVLVFVVSYYIFSYMGL